MANKLGVEEALDYILLPYGIESDLEDDDEWEAEMMKVDDDLDLNYNPDLDINARSLDVEADNLIDYEDQDCADQGDQTIKQQQKKYKWKKKAYSFPDISFKGDFSPPPSNILTPMEYFKFFRDDTCMAYVAEQTNLYALEKEEK